jgi:molybdopterin-guanine dinucleotide biosynthesis protein A
LSALPESVDAAYITSCDVPLLVPAFVERMIELMGDHDIAVMEIDGFPHPLSRFTVATRSRRSNRSSAVIRLRRCSYSRRCGRAA